MKKTTTTTTTKATTSTKGRKEESTMKKVTKKELKALREANKLYMDDSKIKAFFAKEAEAKAEAKGKTAEELKAEKEAKKATYSNTVESFCKMYQMTESEKAELEALAKAVKLAEETEAKAEADVKKALEAKEAFIANCEDLNARKNEEQIEALEAVIKHMYKALRQAQKETKEAKEAKEAFTDRMDALNTKEESIRKAVIRKNCYIVSAKLKEADEKAVQNGKSAKYFWASVIFESDMDFEEIYAEALYKLWDLQTKDKSQKKCLHLYESCAYAMKKYYFYKHQVQRQRVKVKDEKTGKLVEKERYIFPRIAPNIDTSDASDATLRICGGVRSISSLERKDYIESLCEDCAFDERQRKLLIDIYVKGKPEAETFKKYGYKSHNITGGLAEKMRFNYVKATLERSRYNDRYMTEEEEHETLNIKSGSEPHEIKEVHQTEEAKKEEHERLLKLQKDASEECISVRGEHKEKHFLSKRHLKENIRNLKAIYAKGKSARTKQYKTIQEYLNQWYAMEDITEVLEDLK